MMSLAFSIPFMRRSVGKLMCIPSFAGPFLFSFFFSFYLIRMAWQPGVGPDPEEPRRLRSISLGNSPVHRMATASRTTQPTPWGSWPLSGNRFHPWLGYEINYGYTRFTERYSTLPFGVQNNLHEVSGAYLVQGPTIPILGLQPFGAVGVGALIFLPTTVGGQKYNQQSRVPLLYEFGVNYPILTSHLGLRFQYRGLVYKTPDFNSAPLTTNARRQTSEPSVGAYFRF